MERLIIYCGCDFLVDYEWNADKCADIECISLAGNDVTDLLQDSVVEVIRQRLNACYCEDQYDLASVAQLMRVAA